MWTDPVLSSAIMETMESTRRSVVCITDVLVLSRFRCRATLCAGLVTRSPRCEEEGSAVCEHACVKTHEDM
jgi:hypothetical protein